MKVHWKIKSTRKCTGLELMALLLGMFLERSIN